MMLYLSIIPLLVRKSAFAQLSLLIAKTKKKKMHVSWFIWEIFEKKTLTYCVHTHTQPHTTQFYYYVYQ